MALRFRLQPALIAGVAFLAGCDQVADFYSCSNPDRDHVDAQGEPDPCHKRDPAPKPDESCPGQCVPIGPFGWTRDPFLLWIGNEIEAPDCPERAQMRAYEGHADLVAPDECGPCSCGAPSCELPAAITVSDLNVCPNDGPGAMLTPFNAPPDWDGSCVAPPAVPANLLGSVAIAPLTVSPCVPETGPIPKNGQAHWKTYARACFGEAFGPCTSSAEVCSPTAEPPPTGFVQCIGKEGDSEAECPPEYPVRHVFYGDFSDTRECTPCTCSAPSGSDCTAFISLYTDAGCTTDLMGNLLGTDVALCTDVMPGNELQGMSAMWVDNQPGSCQASGGAPYGEALPKDPSTFCCQE